MNWNSTNLDAINKMCKDTLMEHLNIHFDAITSDFISAIMPVNKTTHQPMGLLHGGANVVLIESLGSMASALLCDLQSEAPVGLEVNANHLKSVKNGFVKGIAKPIHIGKSTHVWHVDVIDLNDPEKLLCTGRLTVLIKQLKG